MSFLTATCICVQTGHRLLHKSMFSWLSNCFFSSNSATSAPVECLFRIAGKFLGLKDVPSKMTLLKNLNMMIKCNHQIKSE